MRLGIILGSFSTGSRPLVMENPMTNPRGLTGTETILLKLSEALHKRGHDVSIFSSYTGNHPTEWNGVKIYDLHQKSQIITSDWDCVISLNEPDVFRDIPIGPLRITSQQLNGFSYMGPGYDDLVDLWISPSDAHRERHLTAYGQNLDPNKWIVIPDGCDANDYTPGIKIPGRVIWASSAERGLHWLLQEWSKIKKAVPHASLKIFYNFQYGDLEKNEKGITQASPDIMEFANRIRYCREMIARLKHLDVEHVGSVSRERISKEMSQAECLAYPCDTTVWSEGFSMTILESMNCEAAPVITECDALKDVYGSVANMIPLPVKDHISEWSDLVIKTLNDEKYRKEINNKCKKFSKKYTWDNIAERLENVILTTKMPQTNNVPKVKKSKRKVTKELDKETLLNQIEMLKKKLESM